jgi:hypothetical protein
MIINTTPEKGYLPNLETILQSIDIETLDILDEAITKAKLNADVAGDGLSLDTDNSIMVNVDDATIAIATDALRVKDGGIGNTQLANDTILYVSTTETALYNSTTETIMWTFTLPANSLSTANMVEMSGFFQIDNQSGTTQTLTMQLYYGATLIGTLTTGNLSNSSNLSLVKVSAVLKGDGATNSQEGHLHIDIGGRSLSYDLSGSAAEDSTANKTVAIKITLGAAHANYGFMTESFIARLLKAV